MTDTECPIWQTPAKSLPTTRDGQDVDSARAGGRYFVSGTASAMLKSWDEQKKVLLTSWLVEQRRLGVSCPEISSDTLDEAAKRRPPSVHDRADNLLRYLRAKSDLLGAVLKFYAVDNTKAAETANELLAWTASRKIMEVITLAEYCQEEGWIQHRVAERAGASQNTVHELMLRPPGYARLAELDGINSGSNQAFVAMWFDGSMKDAYDKGIGPAIRKAGYEPLRIDRKEHINKIDDEIIAEIRRSRFLVADFTQGDAGARGGVYYEAGFAHGLNIPVIFTCRTDAIDKVHFDTRQYNHITWATPEELKERLTERISATLGDGPLKKAV
jgi:hypothetical protein